MQKLPQYRSKLEREFACELKRRNIPFVYEPTTFVIYPGFTNSFKEKVSPITYTPDFKLTYKGKTVWVETKGFARRGDLLIFKLAGRYFKERGDYYIPVTSAGHKRAGTYNMYLYRHKGIAKQDKNIINFWDYLDKHISE